MSEHSAKHGSFTLERRIAAPPERVFAAWADPAARERWFVKAEGWEMSEYHQDFRIGGREHGQFRRKAGEPTYANECYFADIVPGRRIVFSYTMDCDGRRISVSLSTVTLEADGGATRLRYTEQAVYLDGLDQEAYREEGWRDLLDRFEAEVVQSA